MKLPELGEGIHEGELSKWRIKPGDTVVEDQALCDIMTDKATVELPSPFYGKVTELLVKEGEVVKVGTPILGYEGIGAFAPVQPPRVVAGTIGGKPQQPQKAEESRKNHEETVSAAPAVRRYAKERGVDLSIVPPSGPDRRVLREDVDRFVSVGSSAVASEPKRVPETQPVMQPSLENLPRVEQRIPFTGLRKRIADKVSLGQAHAVPYTVFEEADATELIRLHARARAAAEVQGVKLTYLPFIFKALVAALRRYPILNASLDEEHQQILAYGDYNIALSVQTEEGLSAPVLRHVDRKSVFELAREIRDLATRTRDKKLNVGDFEGHTITVTNIGSLGGLFATPVLNHPNVAILGFNKISKKPVVESVEGVDRVGIRDWTVFSMTLDHRVVDGAIAVRFMKEFVRYIESPELLFLE